MNIKKISVLCLGVGACLVSCGAKAISKDDAKKFADSTYKDKTVKSVTKISMNYDCTGSKGDTAKAYANASLKFMATLFGFSYTDNSLKLTGELKSGDMFDTYKIPAELIITGDAIELLDNNCKFSVKGSELTYSYEESDDEHKSKNVYTYNGNGQLRYIEEYVYSTDGTQSTEMKGYTNFSF